MELMGKGRNWSTREKEYLEDKWGTLSVKAIAKNLGRTENAVIVMKNRMGLGSFLECGDYVSVNTLMKCIGYSYFDSWKKESWINKLGFPVKRKRVQNNTFMVIGLESFWNWAYRNMNIIDFSGFEENALGQEPEWAKAKRRRDFERNRKTKKSPWTESEDEKLLRLVGSGRYGYREMSEMLGRTAGAIQRRLLSLNADTRPVKADNHNPYTEDEKEIIRSMILSGCGYEDITESTDRSAKALRGYVYRMFGTENLDRARMMMEE